MNKFNENFYYNDAFKGMNIDDIKKSFPLLLTDAEARVFEKRYDDDGNVQFSTREIGRMLNISAARVSETLIQIKNKVLLFSKDMKNQFIDYIKNGNNIIDNYDLKKYYKRLRLDIVSIIKKYNDKGILNPLEKELLNIYLEIDECIDNYAFEIRLSDKAKIIIEYISNNGELPSRCSKDYDYNLTFDDGTFLRYYYDNLFGYITKISHKKKNHKILNPHEKDILCEYISIKSLLDNKNNLNSIDDKIDLNSICYENFNENYLIMDIENLDNKQYIDIVKDAFGLNNGVFKSYSEIAYDYGCSPAYVFKVVERFKNKISYLNGLSNIQIINMINEKRKSNGIEGIISNKLYLLLKNVEESKSYENNVYYLYLKRIIPKIIKKINGNEELNAKEKQLLFEYEKNKEKLSLYEKKGMFIKVIHDHKGYFTKNERDTLLFDDGSRLFTYYYHLRSNVNYYLQKQARGEVLLYKEQKCLEDYYDIKNVFNMYSKTSKLVDTINILHRLPRRKTNGVNEALFDDGSDQYNYYINLKNSYDSIVRRGKGFVSLEEIEILDDYNRIKEALLRNKYNNVYQLIDIINNTKRAPLSGYNDVKFSDGKSSYNYYMKLREKYYAILMSNKNFCSLNNDEKDIIDLYLLVKKNIDKYSKKKQLIETIKRVKRVPGGAVDVSGNKEVMLFDDGSNQRRYYYNLASEAKKLEERYNNGELLNLHDLELIDDYHEIQDVLSFFNKRKEDNINCIKRLCYDNKIDITLNEGILKKSVYEVYVKIKYLLDNNIELVNDNGIVNSIFYMSDYELLNKYNISINLLIDEYINGYENSYGKSYKKKAIKK